MPNQQLRVAVDSVPAGSAKSVGADGFVRGEGGERQGVNGSSELLGQQAVNPALAGDAALALEGGCHDLDAEMRLALGSRTGVTGVAMRLVVDGEPKRVQLGGKLGSDSLGNGHGKGTVKAYALPVKPLQQGSVVALVR